MPTFFGAGKVRTLLSYLISIAAVAVATMLRLGMDPILQDHHPFTLYFATVVLSSWYGGFGPGCLSIILSYFAADWFFITPRFEINWPRENLDEFLALMAFLFSGFAIAITTSVMRKALWQARHKQLELERQIGERKKVEDALREAQFQLRRHAGLLEERVAERTRYLRETISSLEGVCYHLAHDLRAPLRAMDGYTNLLLKDCAANLDITSRGYAGKIVQAAERMDVLIHGLMEYGRLGHEAFEVEPVQAKVMLDKLLAKLISGDHQAKVTLGERWPVVMANESLLELVLLHLLNNALKFVAPGKLPEIHIWAEDHSPWIRFWMEDNGIGLPGEYATKIFGIFERLHPAEPYPGTGIGLAIVAKAVARMKGRVGVEPTLNKGSRFWFELKESTAITPSLRSGNWYLSELVTDQTVQFQ